MINADGEQQAAEKLVEAGRSLAHEPLAMQLRYFEALHDIAGERSSTIVFPLPVDLLAHLGSILGQADAKLHREPGKPGAIEQPATRQFGTKRG